MTSNTLGIGGVHRCGTWASLGIGIVGIHQCGAWPASASARHRRRLRVVHINVGIVDAARSQHRSRLRRHLSTRHMGQHRPSDAFLESIFRCAHPFHGPASPVSSSVLSLSFNRPNRQIGSPVASPGDGATTGRMLLRPMLRPSRRGVPPIAPHRGRAAPRAHAGILARASQSSRDRPRQRAGAGQGCGGVVSPRVLCMKVFSQSCRQSDQSGSIPMAPPGLPLGRWIMAGGPPERGSLPLRFCDVTMRRRVEPQG